MKPNFSKFLNVIFLLALISGTAWLSFTLVSKHLKTQEKQKVEQAKNLLDQKKYPAAIAVYDQLLASGEAQAYLLWLNRGYALSGLAKYGEMLQSCSEATKIEPQAALAWNCRGEALYNLGQYQAALKSFNQGISLDPQSGTFWLNKARVLADLEQYEQAVAAREQGIKLLSELNPQDAANLHNLSMAHNQQGQSLLKLKRNKQALTEFNQSLEYMPDDLVAQQGVGIALYRLELYTKAIKVFTDILHRDDLTLEQQAINWLYQGISFCETPQINSAPKAFKQVLKLTKDSQIQAIAKAGCGIR